MAAGVVLEAEKRHDASDQNALRARMPWFKPKQD